MPQSLSSILNHFTKTRNVAVNPAEKKNARDLIVKTFKDHGLNTWTEEFPSNKAEVKKHWALRIPTTYQGEIGEKNQPIQTRFAGVPRERSRSFTKKWREEHGYLSWGF